MIVQIYLAPVLIMVFHGETWPTPVPYSDCKYVPDCYPPLLQPKHLTSRLILLGLGWVRFRTLYIWHSLFALHNINVKINHRYTLYTHYKHYALNNTTTWFSERHMSNSSSSLTFSKDRLVSAVSVNEQ